MLALMTSVLAMIPMCQDQDKDRDELQAEWSRIITLAREDKVREVAKIVAGWKISKEEFHELFGEDKAKAGYKRYEKYWRNVDQKTAADIVKHIRSKKFESVEVVCINGADEKTLTSNEKTALKSLANKSVKLYSVHFHAKGSPRSYTLPCFMKVGDNWRCGLKFGKTLGR